ncbi:MAG: PadR family transcriptional regulator [Vicinamibacterales bacterium]
MSRAGRGAPGPLLSPTDWHVLVALADEDLHGYGIMKAVQRDSGGAVTAEVGSLYRILSRLMTQGLVDEVDEPDGAPAETRGRARRYYRLTDEGRTALRQESARLARALALARERRLLPRGSK